MIGDGDEQRSWQQGWLRGRRRDRDLTRPAVAGTSRRRRRRSRPRRGSSRRPGRRRCEVRSVMIESGRLTEPVSPRTSSWNPWKASRPASVTTNDGMPNAVTMKPLNRPIAVPTSRPSTIANAGSTPSFTDSTAITAAARPETAPTDRSISPSSSTRTTPIEIVATAAICSVRLVRLIAERKRSFAIWKIVQMTAMPKMTRSEPSSPRASRRSHRSRREALRTSSIAVSRRSSPRSPSERRLLGRPLAVAAELGAGDRGDDLLLGGVAERRTAGDAAEPQAR